MNMEARNKLIEDNMSLVYWLIHRYYPTYSRDEDIVQCGMIGLVRAADIYDETRGKFSSLATTCVLNEIRLELKRRRREDGVVSLDSPGNGEENASLMSVVSGTPDVDVDVVFLYGSTLNDREKLVLTTVARGSTPSELARQLGLTQQAVSKTYRKALKKIRKAMRDDV